MQVRQVFSLKRMLTCYNPPTVQILEPGHLGEDYPITTFFENRKVSIFLHTDQHQNIQQL